jgi:N-carbamoylputrescine amidase
MAGRDEEMIVMACFELTDLENFRTGWGIFRDRRPTQYYTLLTLDGICKK